MELENLPSVPAVTYAKTVTPMGGDAFYKELAAWLNAYSEVIDAIATEAGAMVIEDEDSSARAIALAGGAKKVNNELEKSRKTLVEAPNALLTRINGLFKIYQLPLKDLESDLKHRVAAYRRKAQAEATKARLEAEGLTAQTKTSAPIQPAVTEPARTVKTDMGKATTRKRPKFEITDPDLVPKIYWIIDEMALRRAVINGERNIPGVRIWEEEEVVLHV